MIRTFLYIIAFTTCASVLANADYHYKVAFNGIPKSLHFKNLSDFNQYQVIMQLNETLFTLGKNGYKSEILKNWKSENNFKKFTLCPDDQVSFSNNKKLTAEMLKQNIEYFKNKYSVGINSLEINNHCLVINFNDSYPAFLADSDTYEIPIIDIATAEQDAPAGISPYFIDEKTDKVIHLQIRSDVKTKSDITEISFYAADQVKDLSDIDDLNYLWTNEKIQKIQAERQKYLSQDIKGTYMLINSKDINLRKLIWNCLDKELFLKTVMGKSEFTELNTIIPKGIPFVEYRDISRKCDFKKLPKKKTLTFFLGDIEENSFENANKIMNATFNKYNIEIKMKKKSWEEISAMTRTKEKEYDITLMTIKGNLPYHYLASFLIGNNNLRIVSDFKKIDINKNHINTLENSKNWKGDITKLSKIIENNKNVLPLGVKQTNYYYSKKLELPNIESYFGNGEFKIKDIKIK